MKTLTLLVALALVACGDSAPPAVTVGPVSFGEDQLLGVSPDRRRTLADLTAFALAVADSTTDELGAPLLHRQENDRLLDVLAADLLLEKSGVGDEVLRARYLTDPEYELTVRHILFMSERWRSPAERAAAKAKAERALALVKGGADFAETAAKLSEEPGAAGRQGLLKPGRKGDWVDEFWNAASALQVGEISPVVETQYGYHVLRLENRTIVPFAEARSRVALEVAGQIGDPAAALKAWTDSVGPEVSVSADGLATATKPSPDDATTLARWPGGSLTLRAYLSFAASQPASWSSGGLGSDLGRFRASVEDLARRRMALDEAGRRNLDVPEGTQAQLERAWADSVYQWSASLGFAYGLGPAGVAKAALAALGNAGQQAGLVRTAIDARAPLLEARYEILIGGRDVRETAPAGQP
jgi:hypothetical protein